MSSPCPSSVEPQAQDPAPALAQTRKLRALTWWAPTQVLGAVRPLVALLVVSALLTAVLVGSVSSFIYIMGELTVRARSMSMSHPEAVSLHPRTHSTYRPYGPRRSGGFAVQMRSIMNHARLPK